VKLPQVFKTAKVLIEGHIGRRAKCCFRRQGKNTCSPRLVKLLQVFKTAKVLIEGHTATPDDKLDSWLHTLAQNRAEVVMKQIGAFGVDKSRLSATGLPCKKSQESIRS